tara:strand:- start:63 stop:398 length:336 start_codon:yes stop_codon:yes gene_type:complete
MYFVGFAIFTWLGFRFANSIYQGEAGNNLVGKIFATAYCVLVALSFVNSGLIGGYVLEAYTASICSIDGNSCERLQASASSPLSLGGPIALLLSLVIVLFQLGLIWTKKTD